MLGKNKYEQMRYIVPLLGTSIGILITIFWYYKMFNVFYWIIPIVGFICMLMIISIPLIDDWETEERVKEVRE